MDEPNVIGLQSCYILYDLVKAYIEQMSVSADIRGQGIGTRIVYIGAKLTAISKKVQRPFLLGVVTRESCRTIVSTFWF